MRAGLAVIRALVPRLEVTDRGWRRFLCREHQRWREAVDAHAQQDFRGPRQEHGQEVQEWAGAEGLDIRLNRANNSMSRTLRRWPDTAFTKRSISSREIEFMRLNGRSVYL